jgi:hypothetical protein
MLAVFEDVGGLEFGYRLAAVLGNPLHQSLALAEVAPPDQYFQQFSEFGQAQLIFRLMTASRADSLSWLSTAAASRVQRWSHMAA